ncbi:MAG: ABC transporter ATP-binding protein [Candidatus Poribacteria bacterium]
MQTAIEARQLTKVFTGSKKRAETIAVDSIDLTIQKGEIFGLLGPNGAGKTTTVRMLTCLIQSTSGEAWVEGASILSEPKKVRASCGILTETPGLYVRLNAIEYLNFFGQLYGLSRQELETRVPNVLDMLGIDAKDREGKRLGAFSRGMQQKMNIARAILHNPPVLFLDEPTASLDPESAKMVRDYILNLKEQQQHTILLCTHNLDEADRLCDRIGIIHNGKLMRVGETENLKARLGEQRTYRVLLSDATDNFLAVVRSVTGVNEAFIENGEIVFHTNEPETTNPQVLQALVQANAKILTVSEEAHSLEEVYLALLKEQNR